MTPRPTAGDIRRIEAASLEWVDQNFGHFKPQLSADAKRVGFVTKAAAELAVVCAVASTAAPGTSGAPYRRLARRIWEEIFRDDAVQDHMLASPAEVPSLGFYGSMRQCGFDDLRYRDELLQLLASGYLAAIERPPSSELDFLYSLRVAGFDASAPDTVYRRSMLAHHPSPSTLTTEDVYTMTHAIFFTTDFGRCTPAFFSSADREYFASALPLLTGYYLRIKDWDLTAELLIALSATGVRPPVFSVGWEILSQAQNTDGSYSGPTEGRPADQTPSDLEWIAFRNDYHTTLAVLLALLTAAPA